MNSRFLALYYSRYLRPLMDILILNAEFTLPLMAKVPKLSNAFLSNSIIKSLTKRSWFVDIPLFSEKTFHKECHDNGLKS